MANKLFTLLAIALAIIVLCEARHVPRQRQRDQAYQQRALIGKPHAAQTRVFPGALAIKKLVLLKFKKIVPISLILLKSDKDNEAELVPVYPTDQIPENVQFIPTPNGISGHKDVQAIAIPSELHEQLQLNGLSNVENIEALLQSSALGASSADPEDGLTAVGNAIAVPQPEDVPLQQNDNDDTQLLESESAGPQGGQATVASTRRLSTNELVRSGVRNSPHLQQTSVEEIPLVLYSATDGAAPGQELFSERRFVAATPARRRQKFNY